MQKTSKTAEEPREQGRRAAGIRPSEWCINCHKHDTQHMKIDEELRCPFEPSVFKGMTDHEWFINFGRDLDP